jgi:hypothetical protein
VPSSSADLAPYPPHPHPIHTEGVRLGAEITELCGYIYAATYRLLVLIREFDQQGYWEWPGLRSCAHWLNFKCGIGMNAARLSDLDIDQHTCVPRWYAGETIDWNLAVGHLFQ